MQNALKRRGEVMKWFDPAHVTSNFVDKTNWFSVKLAGVVYQSWPMLDVFKCDTDCHVIALAPQLTLKL